MLTLDLTNAPRWHDLSPGVRVRLRPLTTAMMVAARSDVDTELAATEHPNRDPDHDGLDEPAGSAGTEALALAMAKALARRAVLEWEGIGDADGNPIDPSPEAIDALLDIWPIFEAFQLTYVSKGLLLEQEKNVSAPSPTGTTAGAIVTARPANPPRAASKPARTARRG